MKQNAKADIAPAKVSDNLVKEVLHLVAATTATKPELPEHARQRLQAKVKATFALAECGQHTLGKWKVLERYTDRQAVPIGVEIASSGGLAHSVFAEAHGSNCDANAAFIVTACNAHDQLVSALKRTVARLEHHLCNVETCDMEASDDLTLEEARAALAQAQKSA